MKKLSIILILILLVTGNTYSQELLQRITLKSPGNPAESYELRYDKASGRMLAQEGLPIQISQQITDNGSVMRINTVITAQEKVYYNYEQVYKLSGIGHHDCNFYMPGFWYHKNERSPENAPSFRTSDSWQVREDRLSTPLTGIYNEKNGDYYTVLRLDDFRDEALTTHSEGEIILGGKTSIGFTGFRNMNGTTALVFGFPYHEAPKTYLRKLTLAPEVQAFEKLEKGETRELVWEIKKGNSPDFSTFVADTWKYSYDTFKPQRMEGQYTPAQAKEIMSNYFMESYVDKYQLKYFSAVHMKLNSESTSISELGFVGRTILNAFNALEYGEENNRPEIAEKANAIFNSYVEHGFTPNGFFREWVDHNDVNEPQIYSIRRQSEGAFAILNYLDYEKKKGRKHPEWEARMKKLLANFLELQEENGSFPRKFDDDFKIFDKSGGSTPSTTLPLVMAYHYFKDKTYLESARRTANYLEKEIISKADYFSSTLDSNCEDKEASLYASTAMYYLSMVTKGKEREHYIDLSKEAAYFALSWYYVWDLPFAQGQMLGDVDFKSRGWGNVSVENNHIDVFIFEFATVLDWLARERNEPRFAAFSEVIKTSMLQLMPVKGHMFLIGKVGYYPEVVQHTNWDYGKNGKGFYNDIFAPGWTIASLWQMLSPDRVNKYFAGSKKR